MEKALLICHSLAISKGSLEAVAVHGIVYNNPKGHVDVVGLGMPSCLLP